MLGLRLRRQIRLPGIRLRMEVAIGALVTALLLIVSALLVSYDNIQGRQIATDEARERFESVGQSLGQEIQLVLAPIESVVETNATIYAHASGQSLLSLVSAIGFAGSVQKSPFLSALYYADLAGNLVGAFGRASGSNEKTPRIWRIEQGTEESGKYITYNLDNDFRVVSEDTRFNNGYDPRSRDWFHMALRADRTIRVGPYPYFDSAGIGFTVAHRTPDGNGVVAGDLTLADLSAALEKLRVSGGGRSIIFDRHGRLLAADDANLVVSTRRADDRPIIRQRTLADVEFPEMRAVNRVFAAGTFNRVVDVNVDGTDWSVWISLISLGQDDNAWISVVTPSAELFGAITRRTRIGLAISAIAIAIGILLAWGVARIFSRPISALTEEAYRIQQFNLQDRHLERSRIIEVDQLTAAVEAMRSSARDFARYVPEEIVRQLVAGGLSANIGGEKRQVTLIITDIADFTTIAEELEVEAMMRQVSVYFGELVGRIIEDRGTVDKFVGDAVMAFWNAPTLIEDHVARACRAALRCAVAANRLNSEWVRDGLKPFYTRFGVHTGECIVGNVGTQQRLDYTVMGSTVNLVSRLEGLNKHYGTQILASEDIQKASDRQFLFRPVDLVLAKGATQPVQIFELAGYLPDAAAVDRELVASSEILAQFAAWREIFDIYRARDWGRLVDAVFDYSSRFPADPVARVYAERAERFFATPPPDDWNGVEVYSTK